MSLREVDQRYAVRNANYDRVLSVLDRYLKKSPVRVCTCERCVNDIIAYALNCLPPHYCANKGREQDAGSPWVMVESAVCEAVERVQEHPHRPCSRARMS